MHKTNVNGVRIIPIFNGKCLFQLRDDKPNIQHPNKWSFISGSLEEGESWEEGMRRECFEEIGIDPKDLRYLGHSEVSACFYAYLSEEEVNRLVLGEGQEIRFFNPAEMPELDMTPRLHELVHIYKDSLAGLIAGDKFKSTDFGLMP